jgi:ABC-type branched-subunit amino acid transport system ATPase component
MLALSDVAAGYGAVRVLDRLSLTVGGGEIVALLGVNGSGKSTVLKTVMGLTRQMQGRITFDGAAIDGLASHARAAVGLGYVPQRGNVFPDLSVADNLRMGAFLQPARLDAELPRVFALFPRLAERRQAAAGSLSGGERRMLSIAMTLLLSPRLLLMDEPSSDLAPAMVATVAETIGRLHGELGLPVLLVEQNVAMALGLAHRVLVLARGTVIADMDRATAAKADLHALFMAGVGS